MNVSLTRGTVIFTLYQCCADLCCRDRHTDTQRPYDMAHIPGTFSMGYKPHAHTAQPGLFMYAASTNSGAATVAAAYNRSSVTDQTNGQSRV